MSLIARVQVYRDAACEWRYRALAANGEEVDRGSEGYLSRTYTQELVAELFPGVPVETLDRKPAGA